LKSSLKIVKFTFNKGLIVNTLRECHGKQVSMVFWEK
jgi:hypothetical protein